MESKRNPVILIDGNYLLHRVMHINNYLSLSYNGVFTGGVYGFIKSLQYSTAKFMNPHQILVIWDGHHSVRRERLHERYKARPERPETVVTPVDTAPLSYDAAFRFQSQVLQVLLPALGVSSLKQISHEADDVIAYIAREISSWLSMRGHDVVIVSDDKDYLQLYDPNISIYRPLKDEFVDPFTYKITTGYDDPLHFIYHLSLIGDSSDNIRGIPGFGSKTARRVIKDIEFSDHLLKDAMLIADSCRINGTKIDRSFNGIINPEAGKNEQVTGMQLFIRNCQLIDFRYEVFSELEQQQMWDLITKTKSFIIDEYKIADILSQYGFHSFIKKFRFFLEPFRNLEIYEE